MRVRLGQISMRVKPYCSTLYYGVKRDFVFIEFFPSFGLFEDGKGPLLANKKNIPYTVMVEGNVGAGKSTLVDILSR